MFENPVLHPRVGARLTSHGSHLSVSFSCPGLARDDRAGAAAAQAV